MSRLPHILSAPLRSAAFLPLLAAVVAAHASGLLVSVGRAQPPAGPAAKDAPPASGAAAPANAPEADADVSAAQGKLESGDANQVGEGLELLGTLDHPKAVAPIAKLLAQGPPDAVTNKALRALGALAKPEGLDVLEPYTRHRRPEARRLAFEGVAAIEGPRSRAIVERGLGDSDRGVRGTCARLLGEMRARASVPLLLRALSRGVVEAAASIGTLGDGASVAAFHAELGKQPIGVMLAGYRAYLGRADLPARAKDDIVTRLGEVAGPAVKRFFTELAAAPPRSLPRPVLLKVRDLARRIRDPKANPKAKSGAKPAPAAAQPSASPPSAAPSRPEAP